jgi:ribonucleotide monophosphatase NagD (HAD superfamily)
MKSLSADYPVWFCDIWGVVHNGLKGYEAAAHALSQHRNRVALSFCTNAPRTSRGGINHLKSAAKP